MDLVVTEDKWNVPFIIQDNFLNNDMVQYADALSFLTPDDRWDVIKLHLPNAGGTTVSNSISCSYHTSDIIQKMNQIFRNRLHEIHKMVDKLSVQKQNKKYRYEVSVVNIGKNYKYKIHRDSAEKILSVVIYISNVGRGTIMYDDHEGKNPREIPWEKNRAFAFCPSDDTWHSYEADGVNQRRSVVINVCQTKDGNV
jgi:hypothetical protein